MLGVVSRDTVIMLRISMVFELRIGDKLRQYIAAVSRLVLENIVLTESIDTRVISAVHESICSLTFFPSRMCFLIAHHQNPRRSVEFLPNEKWIVDVSKLRFGRFHDHEFNKI